MPGECGHQTAKERFRSQFHASRRSSRRERGPDGTKERPFDVGSSPASQPLFGEHGDV